MGAIKARSSAGDAAKKAPSWLRTQNPTVNWSTESSATAVHSKAELINKKATKLLKLPNPTSVFNSRHLIDRYHV
jgi:hypothetical protein